MKVVINSCFGGFGLSDAAIKRCIELGMILTEYNGSICGYEDPTADFVVHEDEDEDCDYGNRLYGIIDDHSPDFRSDPRVIQVVEEMGEEANISYSKLKVIDIPMDGTNGWIIDEYNEGKECVISIKERWR